MTRRPNGSKRSLTRLGIVYFVLASAAVVWPIYPWLGDHIEPRVLGLPWSLVWVLGVIVANFVVLAALYRYGGVDHAEVDPGPRGDPRGDA